MEVNRVYKFTPPAQTPDGPKEFLKYYGRIVLTHKSNMGMVQTTSYTYRYVFVNPNTPDNPKGQAAHSPGITGGLEVWAEIPEPRYVFEADQFNTLPGRYSVALPAPGDVVGGKRRRKTQRRKRRHA